MRTALSITGEAFKWVVIAALWVAALVAVAGVFGPTGG